MPTNSPGPEGRPPHHGYSTPAAAPPSAPAEQQPAPYAVTPRGPRPLPSVGIIWLNIVVFGWFLGLGLIFGIVRSIQGIARSRERGLSPTRYVIPLVVIAAVFLGLVALGVAHSNQSDDSSAASIPGHVSQVINRPPAGVSTAAAQRVTPVAVYPAPGTTLDDQIKQSGVVENAKASGSGQAIIAGFNAAWDKACATNNPAPLWGVIQDLQGNEYSDLKDLSYFCHHLQFTLTGNPSADPQATVGSPLRWYLISVRQPDSSFAAATPRMFRLYRDHWLLVDSAVNPDTGLTASGYNAEQVVSWMEALRDQAIIQRSQALLSKYWDNYGQQADDSPVIPAQEALVAAGANPGTFSISNVRDLGGAILATVSDRTGTRHMRYTFVPSANNQPSVNNNRWSAEPEGSN